MTSEVGAGPRRSRLIATVLVLAAFLLTMRVGDTWAWQHLHHGGVYQKDWGRMLRIMGYAPLWWIGAAALMLARWPRARVEGAGQALRPGLALAVAVLVSLALGELIKLVIRRGRPNAADGAYTFVPWHGHSLNTGPIGMPSTHAIVAFAAAFALARLFPRTGPVWFLLAVGCGLTRILEGAHFLSDVVVAGVLAWLVVAWLWRRWAPPVLEL